MLTEDELIAIVELDREARYTSRGMVSRGFSVDAKLAITVPRLLQHIEEQAAEIAKLREALRKMDERYGCVVSASGQGHDGKWHEVKVCQVCGATIKTSGKGHEKHCTFYVMEEK